MLSEGCPVHSLPLLLARYKWLITKGQWLAPVPVFEEISQTLWTIYPSYQIRVSKIFINQLAIHVKISRNHLVAQSFNKKTGTQNKLTSNLDKIRTYPDRSELGTYTCLQEVSYITNLEIYNKRSQ